MLSSSPPTDARSLEFLVGSEKPGGVWCYRLGECLEYSVGGKHFHFLHYIVECESGAEDGRAASTAQRENLPRDPVLSQWSALDFLPDTFNTSRWCTCSGLQRPIVLLRFLSFLFFSFYQSHSIYAVGMGPACKTPYEVGKLINGTVILRAQPCACLGAVQEWSSVNNKWE